MVCVCGQSFPLDLSNWRATYVSHWKAVAGHWDSIANGALMCGDPI